MKRDLEQEVEELREQKAALIDEIAYKDGQLYELRDAVVSKEIEIDQLKSEVKRQRSTIDRLERTISGLEERLDKAAELHLDTDKVQLTRIEMTCDGEWTAEQLEEHWPQVHAWHSESGTKDYIRVIGIMLAEKAERNEDVETLINMLGRTSRPKVREYLRTPCVKLPDGAAALLLAEAKSWCGAVVGSMSQAVTTGRRVPRSRGSKPTRSPAAELTRRASNKTRLD